MAGYSTVAFSALASWGFVDGGLIRWTADLACTKPKKVNYPPISRQSNPSLHLPAIPNSIWIGERRSSTAALFAAAIIIRRVWHQSKVYSGSAIAFSLSRNRAVRSDIISSAVFVDVKMTGPAASKGRESYLTLPD